MEKQIINYASGVERFSGHEELYKKYLKKFVDGTEYREFASAMENKQYEAAFSAAHTLKGVTGNLSFDRFYDKLCKIVEMLRDNKDIPAAATYFSEIESEYELLMTELKNRFK